MVTRTQQAVPRAIRPSPAPGTQDGFFQDLNTELSDKGFLVTMWTIWSTGRAPARCGG